MSGKFLLDTNIIIAIINNEESVIHLLSQTLDTFVPSIVIGELYFGAYNSNNVDSNLAIIDEICKTANLLYVDENTARAYGSIKAELKKSGTPIPENDIWIAAFAMQNDLILVSRDAHFKNVKGIASESW